MASDQRTLRARNVAARLDSVSAGLCGRGSTEKIHVDAPDRRRPRIVRCKVASGRIAAFSDSRHRSTYDSRCQLNNMVLVNIAANG